MRRKFFEAVRLFGADADPRIRTTERLDRRRGYMTLREATEARAELDACIVELEAARELDTEVAS
jgi:hypothetical protein